MRVIVCGGRDFYEWRTLHEALIEVMPSGSGNVIIQGGASGADRLAIKWAEANGASVVTYPANWRSGKKGGPMRNQFMLEDSRPDMLIAFPGGAGTADMVHRAAEAGLPIRRFI